MKNSIFKIWEAGVILLALAGFWGMLYPDLCFTEDVCRVVYADSTGGTAAENKDGDPTGKEADTASGPRGKEKETDLFTGLCEAEPGQVRIKFRLLEDKKERKESKGKENVGKKERSTAR